MGLGDFKGSNDKSNNGNGIYERKYSSRLTIRGYQPQNSGKQLNFSYKSGMLVISIERIKEGGFEPEVIADSYITVTKAKLLVDAIETFKKEKTHSLTAGYGISTGMSEIQRALILHGSSNGTPAITIGKYNGQTGEWVAKDTFEFNDQDFHFFLNWTDKDSNKATPIYNNNVEFDLFENTIRNFANTMDGAAAYAAVDMLKIDFKAVLNKLNPVYDKLGIERNLTSRTSNNVGNFFGAGGSSEHKSLDDVMPKRQFNDSSSYDDED